ncbi:MAG: hypothetical protein NC427_06350 [Ruminococcus flavefaciens]|nr:hypothetical protein [Ruminococcus flavefaciens]
MELENIRGVIRRIDYTLSDSDIDNLSHQCIVAVENGTFDFSAKVKEVFTQSGKRRVIYHYPKLSVENFICHYLKKRLDNVFKIKYASRSKIINLLFNTIPVLKNMNDFVIIRADFKSFFDSVRSRFVYEKYVLPSLLSRGDKDILEKYIDEFKYCYAGLCLSNGMTEIVCRDFDKRLKAKLTVYGVFFYERYVDDMLIMLNTYISQDEIIDIINKAINETFGRCPVKLSTSPGKFSYISRRGMVVSQKFNFLGYEFFINELNGKISFQYGIAEKKRKRYSNIIERAFAQYAINQDEELLRQRIKIFSSRVVVARQLVGTSFDWLTKGIVANYNELRNYTEYLHSDTEEFLKNLYYVLLRKYHLKRPYFIPKRCEEQSMYNLFSNMKRNRTLLFEQSIGIPQEILLEWMSKIDPSYSSRGKDYYRIVVEYLEKIKIE